MHARRHHQLHDAHIFATHVGHPARQATGLLAIVSLHRNIRAIPLTDRLRDPNTGFPLACTSPASTPRVTVAFQRLLLLLLLRLRVIDLLESSHFAHLQPGHQFKPRTPCSCCDYHLS